MIEVIFNWIYILIHCIVTGTIFFAIIYKLTGYIEKSLGMIIMSGIAFLTVYAQYFSLVYKVGFLANIVLILIEIVIVCILQWTIDENGLWQIVQGSLNEVLSNRWKAVIVIALFFIYAANTSGEPIHYDTYLYHAQSIRWIEEYGIVKGLGNLHNRFAYNSAVFAFQSLFSMAFILGKSLHTMNGFIVWTATSVAVYNIKIFEKKGINLSDALCFMIFFINISPDNLSSVQSDTFMENITAFIILKLIILFQKKEDNYVPYAVLSILALFDTTVKLSSAIVVIVALIPLTKLIAKKQIFSIIKWMVLGIVVVSPFFIRNIIISGYLVYPFQGVDIFNVWWKMPKSVVETDAKEIAYWARHLNDTNISMYDNVRIFDWWPHYFLAQNMKYKLLILADIVIFPFYFIRMFMLFRKKSFDVLFCYCIVLGGYLFWFVQAPLPRYGRIWIVLLLTLPMGEIIKHIVEKGIIKINGIVGMVIPTLIVMVMMMPGIKGAVFNNNWIKQADYRILDSVCYQVDGVNIYAPKEGDLSGYHMFPASEKIRTGIYLREPGDVSKGIGAN